MGSGCNHTGLKGRSWTRGVTLIELIIAMAISMILSAIIYAVVISQSRAYTIQDNMTRMQQSLRISMEFIARNLAMAGYGTPGYTLTDIIDEIPGGLLPAIRGFNGGSGESDVVQVVYVDPTNLVMTAWDSTQECLTTSLIFSNTSDASKFADASDMLCFDYSDTSGMRSYVFTVVSANSSTGVVTITTPDNTEYYGSSGQCPSDENLPRDLQCGPAMVMTFYIDRVSSDGLGPGTAKHPVLMMSTALTAFQSDVGVLPTASDMAIADNVEDLQLEVCRSTDGTPPACDSADEWDVWLTEDNTATAVTAVRQVKVTMWARGDRSVPEGKTAPSAVNPLTGAADGYQRHRDSTVVLLRNMRLLEEF